jgi:uncharacterized membrane protein
MSHKKNSHAPAQQPHQEHAPKHHHDIFENRNQFQLERLMLFTDAVIAIAITLLILEVKIPESIHHANNSHQVWQSIKEILPKLFGFFLSFVLIGVYWATHHRMYRYIINYNVRLIWLNLFLLLAIVFLPFTTDLAFEVYTRDFDLVFLIYGFNHFIINFIFYRTWCYISKDKNNLSTGLNDKKRLLYYKYRSLSPMFFFVISMLLCFGHSGLARLLPIIIPFNILLINRIFGYKD